MTAKPSADAKYQDALRQCATVAREEFSFVSQALSAARGELERLEAQLHAPLKGNGGSGLDFQQARAQLQVLHDRLRTEATERLQIAQAGLEGRRQRLDHFTVALFGRTMAGKSTIREALTMGTGATIGQGAQNTTRRIHAYPWRQLSILDAPGIASSDESLREQLDALARQAFQRADVVLFLLSSDGIQQAVFEGLCELRELAKPVIFVLNYKYDLQRGVLRRRFLADGALQAQRIRDEIAGHEERLRSFACQTLGMRETDVRVIAIHAQAAFLGRHRTTAEEISLDVASNIGALHETLATEIVRSGVIRRLQTLLDGTSHDLGEVCEFLLSASRQQAEQSRQIAARFRELDAWCDHFISDTNDQIASEVQVAVAGLRGRIAGFVEDHLERQDVAARWKKLVESEDLGGWAQRWQQGRIDALSAQLQEFARQAEVEREIGVGAAQIHVESFDPLDVKRGLGRAAAALGAIESVLFGGAVLNWWNPAGWVMGALAGAGVLLGVLSWFWDDRESEMSKKRAEAREALHAGVDKMAQDIERRLRRWFYESITQAIRGLRGDQGALVRGLEQGAGALRSTCAKLKGTIEELDLRLILRTAQALRQPVEPRHLVRVARQPGQRAKLLVHGSADKSVGPRIGRALGEWIDLVPQGTPTEEVARSLTPAQPKPRAITIQGEVAHVRVAPAEVGKAVGKQGLNVKLASRLVRLRIHISSEEPRETPLRVR
jgi:hypothetical protein